MDAIYIGETYMRGAGSEQWGVQEHKAQGVGSREGGEVFGGIFL